MGPLALAGIGAGLGLLKTEAFDKNKEKKDRALAAETARYSPWTGMKPVMPQRADMLGNMMQGGMTGAMMGQAMATTDATNKLMDAQSKFYAAQAPAAAAAPAAVAPAAAGGALGGGAPMASLANPAPMGSPTAAMLAGPGQMPPPPLSPGAAPPWAGGQPANPWMFMRRA